MKLRWFTTAAFTLTEGDTTVAFDPFLGLPLKKRWPDLSGAAFQDATAVFVTHGHVDHILELPTLCAGSTAPVYATATPCRTLQKHGVPGDRLHRIQPGAAVTVGPFQVQAYPGRHCRFDGPLIRQTVPRLCRHPLRAARLLGSVLRRTRHRTARAARTREQPEQRRRRDHEHRQQDQNLARRREPQLLRLAAPCARFTRGLRTDRHRRVL